MKKLLAFAATAALTASLAVSVTACGNSANTITVGASQTPHAEILNVIKEDLKAEGYRLKVKIFDDYITPNTALWEGSLDANYFQHTPYLNTFNAQYNTDLVAVDKIHYEPFGIYGKEVSPEDYDANKTGRTILIPNDGSNLARALYLLQDEGYIDLKNAEFSEALTVNDIGDSKGNTVKPVDAPTVALLLAESANGTLAVVNGNYALQAGLKSADALAFENDTGDAAQLYANVIAVKRGNETNPKIQALLKALKSQKVIDFINSTYQNAVKAVFSL